MRRKLQYVRHVELSAAGGKRYLSSVWADVVGAILPRDHLHMQQGKLSTSSISFSGVAC